MEEYCNKPLAAPGLISYRCKTIFGWCMIGAKDDDHALREAARSTHNPQKEDLQIWNGKEYIQVKDEGRKGNET